MKSVKKVCPILAIGWVSVKHELKGRAIYDEPKDVKHIQCLEEGCQLWSDHYVNCDNMIVHTTGKCGLKGVNK